MAKHLQESLLSNVTSLFDIAYQPESEAVDHLVVFGNELLVSSAVALAKLLQQARLIACLSWNQFSRGNCRQPGLFYHRYNSGLHCQCLSTNLPENERFTGDVM